MKTIEIGRILLADDGSEPADRARRLAVELAAQHHAKLSIVYVQEPFQDEADAQRTVAVARSMAEDRNVSYDVMTEAPVGITNPGRRIVTAAEDCAADIIVIGARGLGGIGRLLLGSVSSYVVHHAPCSVLVAR